MVQGVRYVGTDSRNRRYTVTAASTRQAHADADRVALEKPEADMTLGNGHWVALTDENGTFDRESRAIDLTGQVRFFHDDGHQMTNDCASLDFRAGPARPEGRRVGKAGVSSL